MKLLVINPNTTQAVTDMVVCAAREAASRGTRITGVTGRNGPAVIASREGNEQAKPECLALAKRHARGHDAIVLGVSLDTALAELRSRHRIPVVGMTEAGCRVAASLAPRFGVLTFGSHMVPLYGSIVRGYGFGKRLAAVDAVDFHPTAVFLEPDKVGRATLRKVKAMRALGAGAVVLAGAVYAGMNRILQPLSALPLVDGMASAVLLAETLVRERAR